MPEGTSERQGDLGHTRALPQCNEALLHWHFDIGEVDPTVFEAQTLHSITPPVIFVLLASKSETKINIQNIQILHTHNTVTFGYA